MELARALAAEPSFLILDEPRRVDPARAAGRPCRLARDVAFQRAQRLAALEHTAKGAEIMASNPAVMRFMGRDAGIMVLIKLVQMSIAADGAGDISYSDIGSRFGVSRTHVRLLLEDAAKHGDVSLTGRGGRLAVLTPSILQAFDLFLADSMSGHDLLYRLARQQLAKAQRSAASGKLD